MALTIPEVKQSIKELKEQEADIKRKIRALEDFLGSPKPAVSTHAVTRGSADIRPAVQEIFGENGNEPMQLKDIMVAVKGKNPDMDTELISRKMFNVIRTILVKEGYGKYRLKQAV